eukprot:TRINITY_DN28914_c0_g2_i1.p1 TRINITY_DN28914_c0_g2~~TRINITY_DN28914_c0_g2_i1.p1  ORF type:complete len:621 (+),score=135.97 TRINITY_DN28914_c0_g2_i1:196-2058(+)
MAQNMTANNRKRKPTISTGSPGSSTVSSHRVGASRKPRKRRKTAASAVAATDITPTAASVVVDERSFPHVAMATAIPIVQQASVVQNPHFHQRAASSSISPSVNSQSQENTNQSHLVFNQAASAVNPEYLFLQQQLQMANGSQLQSHPIQSFTNLSQHQPYLQSGIIPSQQVSSFDLTTGKPQSFTSHPYYHTPFQGHSALMKAPNVTLATALQGRISNSQRVEPVFSVAVPKKELSLVIPSNNDLNSKLRNLLGTTDETEIQNISAPFCLWNNAQRSSYDSMRRESDISSVTQPFRPILGISPFFSQNRESKEVDINTLKQLIQKDLTKSNYAPIKNSNTIATGVGPSSSSREAPISYVPPSFSSNVETNSSSRTNPIFSVNGNVTIGQGLSSSSVVPTNIPGVPVAQISSSLDLRNRIEEIRSRLSSKSLGQAASIPVQDVQLHRGSSQSALDVPKSLQALGINSQLLNLTSGVQETNGYYPPESSSTSTPKISNHLPLSLNLKQAMPNLAVKRESKDDSRLGIKAKLAGDALSRKAAAQSSSSSTGPVISSSSSSGMARTSNSHGQPPDIPKFDISFELFADFDRAQEIQSDSEEEQNQRFVDEWISEVVKDLEQSE